jgi:plastocyanin
VVSFPGRATVVATALGLAACWGGHLPTRQDAPIAIDAAADAGDAGDGDPMDAGLVNVYVYSACPTTWAAEITSEDATMVYTPATTSVGSGQTVKFAMSPEHSVDWSVGLIDSPLYQVGFGGEKCFQFPPGHYEFVCGYHGSLMTGMLDVH